MADALSDIALPLRSPAQSLRGGVVRVGFSSEILQFHSSDIIVLG